MPDENMRTPRQDFVGTWVTEEEDSDVVFNITVVEGSFHVSGFSPSDGEAFDISDIVWDKTRLSFNALMPSTGFRSRNSFIMLPDGTAELELTTYETWKKVKAI